MKLRISFVSNSSTSSYICAICGEHAEGQDLSLSDCEMFECINGHTMCLEHAISDLIHAEADADEEDYPYEIAEECCPICNFQEISYADARDFLRKEYEVSEKEVFQKIKEINKRRKKLYDEEYVREVFERFSLDDDKFLKEIKARFPTYKEYVSYKKTK